MEDMMTTRIDTLDRTVTAGSTLKALPDFLGKIAGGVTRYVTLARAERQLEALDDRLLADVGLKRSEIRRMVWGNDFR
jgi:uncharacterized protein YjiS (DUF1127 family)